MANFKHGMARSRMYNIWRGMKARCLNPKHVRWEYYGGRGVTICQEWLDSFKAFYDDMGDPPSILHTLDRKDNNKGYNKENCKWSTVAEQNANKRDRMKEEVCDF